MIPLDNRLSRKYEKKPSPIPINTLPPTINSTNQYPQLFFFFFCDSSKIDDEVIQLRRVLKEVAWWRLLTHTQRQREKDGQHKMLKMGLV